MLAFTVRNQELVAQKKPLPRLRSRWALVRVRLAGICNTDVEILRGYHNFRGVPGHEFVGAVAAVSGVSAKEKKRWIGRRVTGDINVSCSAYGYRPLCTFCKRRLKTHCARRTVLGIVNHDGAFAEYLALPLENLHVIPPAISDERAVFEQYAERSALLKTFVLRQLRIVDLACAVGLAGPALDGDSAAGDAAVVLPGLRSPGRRAARWRRRPRNRTSDAWCVLSFRCVHRLRAAFGPGVEYMSSAVDERSRRPRRFGY